jgi:hypothetical protein
VRDGVPSEQTTHFGDLPLPIRIGVIFFVVKIKARAPDLVLRRQEIKAEAPSASEVFTR